MRPSSPSKAHSTQVPIKVQHKIAKKGIRRRRVDLPCGCSYFISIACHNHGFTHRGTHHCRSSREWRVYLGDSKSPYFKITQHHNRPFLMKEDIITVQIQFNHNLRKALGIHKCFLEFSLPG
uniref:Transcriptional activator protein n=1 Tax=Croton yellow vein mosaic virus TaxID=207697 RepID=A0A344V6P7_9GEMI|nr:TrAP protein [Croton yellow vein mosaic virus]